MDPDEVMFAPADAVVERLNALVNAAINVDTVKDPKTKRLLLAGMEQVVKTLYPPMTKASLKVIEFSGVKPVA